MFVSSVSHARALAPGRRARTRRVTSIVARASCGVERARGERTTRMIMISIGIAGLVQASPLAIAHAKPASGEGIECTMMTPCTPPPPDGKARYELPGTTYDPAKEAELRFIEKMNGGGASAKSAEQGRAEAFLERR